MRPPDILEFWERTVARAARQPLEAATEGVAEPVPFVKERVTYGSLGNVQVRAYVSTPCKTGADAGARRLPAIVTAPGYGGWEFGTTLDECQRGYVILQVYPRSQGESGELWRVDDASYQAWVNWGKHDREGFYYQGAYIDVMRGVDYLLTRDDVDPERIGLMGTSQGGGIVLAVGGIDQRIKAVVSNVPYLCNFRENRAYATLELASDFLFLDTFDYFDPVNLALFLTAPTLVSSGGQDATCPADAIRTVFDRLPGIKALAHYPNLKHESCMDFYRMRWQWMDMYPRQGLR